MASRSDEKECKRRITMTNRQLTKIVNLYQEGVSSEICVAAIMDLAKDLNSLARASWIHKFYDAIIKKEN